MPLGLLTGADGLFTSDCGLLSAIFDGLGTVLGGGFVAVSDELPPLAERNHCDRH